MNSRLQAFLSSLWNNPHTRGAAVALLILFGVCYIGPIWFPHYTDQFKATESAIFKLVVVVSLWINGSSGIVSPGDTKTETEKKTQ